MRMASLGVRWVGNGGYLTSSSSMNSEEQSCVCWRRLVPGLRKTGQSHRLSVTASRSGCRLSGTASAAGLDKLVLSDRAGGDWKQFGGDVLRKEKVMDKEDRSKKLDQWMRESVEQIVNNIEEAPFLVHIYPDDERKGSSSSNTAVKLEVEKAVAEDWPAIRRRWESGSPTPNGVILVEELKINDSASRAEEEDKTRDMNSTQLNPATKVWGLLIQAKGLNCTACYILKTSRVQGFLGFCTHFCLLRVECFVDNAETQLKKLWLQR